MREVLHEVFPRLLGYGKLYDTESHTDAYQMDINKIKKRKKKGKPKRVTSRDAVYVTLLSRLDQEKISRNRIAGKVVSVTSSKERTATQVKPSYCKMQFSASSFLLT